MVKCRKCYHFQPHKALINTHARVAIPCDGKCCLTGLWISNAIKKHDCEDFK